MAEKEPSPLEKLLQHPDVDCWPLLRDAAIETARFLSLVKQHFSDTDYNKIIGFFESASTAQDCGLSDFVSLHMSSIKQIMGDKAGLLDNIDLPSILDNLGMLYVMKPEEADLQQAFLAVFHPQDRPFRADELYRHASAAPEPKV